MSDLTVRESAFESSVQRLWIVSRILFVVGAVLMVMLAVGLCFALFLRAVAQGIGAGFAEMLLGRQAEDSTGWIFAVLAYLSFFVLPVLLFLPITVPLALRWKNPQRIVLFRRFNIRRENALLKRIVGRHLGRFGHVFTLSDSQIHKSLWVRIPGLLGQLGFMHFRLRKVTGPRGMAALQRVLERRWRLNMNWLLSLRKIFAIETSDAWWQPCVEALLADAQLIVVEVSQLSDNMDWEMAALERRGLLSRTLLLVHRDRIAQGRAALSPAAALIDDALFVYADRGLEEPDALRRQVARILARPGVSRRPPPALQVAATVGATLVLSLSLAAAGLLFSSPYLLPELAGRYSPFKFQVMTAFIRSNDPEILSRLVAKDRAWTLAALRQHAAQDADTGVALNALADFGGEAEIAFLVDQVARNTPVVQDADATMIDTVFRRERVDVRALRTLATRLGKPALRPLLAAVAQAPRMPFDGGLYDQVISVDAGEADRPFIEPLLASPSQAGRFIAALQLAPHGSGATAPILLEMVRATSHSNFGVGAEVREFLKRMSLSGVPGLEPERLDPYLLDNDEAAELAVGIALSSAGAPHLAQILRHVPAGRGQALLMQAVADAQGNDKSRADPARALLAGADTAWVHRFLDDPDPVVAVDAAYAVAAAGDARVIDRLLAASKLSGECRTLLFIHHACRPQAGTALAALVALREGLHAPTRFEIGADAVAGLDSDTFAALLALSIQAADHDAIGRLLASMDPETRPDDRSMLQDIGERWSLAQLRALVEALPRQPDAHGLALLTPLAWGMELRDDAPAHATDLCTVARAAGRADIVQAWRATSQPCEQGR